MPGLTFFSCTNLRKTTRFYTERIGMKLWLDQGGCAIFQYDNLLVGFCEKEEVDPGGLITYYYDTNEEVDEMYGRLKEIARDRPKENPLYKIYHFYADGPDGRSLEFQRFLNPVPPSMCGDSLLKTRRSIRRFTKDPVPDALLDQVFELCRYSPTSRNSESYYFVIIRNRHLLNELADIRPGSSDPIRKAPLAVAVCANSEKTKRPSQDADIAAYHFLLAARVYGLGTCWIADMNRVEVKRRLDVPQEHIIATITPLGFPEEEPGIPDRRKPKNFIREID